MFKRQKTGSVVCASCGSLVGVNDEQCYTCGRRNPGLWGFAPILRRLGNDFGFVTMVVYGCTALYLLTLLVTVLLGGNIRTGFEDTIYLRRGRKADDNAELVRWAVELVERLGQDVASAGETRKMLGLAD